MKPGKKNSYNSLSDIKINDQNYKYFSLKKAEENGLEGISKLPKSIKVLLENLLRYEDDLSVTKNQKLKLHIDLLEFCFKITQEFLLLQI